MRKNAGGTEARSARGTGFGLTLAAVAVVALGGLALLQALVMGSPTFRLPADGSSLRVAGVTPGYESEVVAVFARDLGRSLAAVDIDERRRQLRRLLQVRDARVARVWPNSLYIEIDERVPIAALTLSDSPLVRMIDADGVILESRGPKATSLPSVTGIAEEMPMADRRARLDLYQRVMRVFEQRGRAKDVQEVNLMDPTNAVVWAKHRRQVVELQMGDRNLPHRLDVFLSYFDSWQAEFGLLESVDLRFERQVALRPQPETGGKG
ncbi:MAG: cell division protein FtsQ/DivIB [Bryobacterales bacterium]|nr:cell division protein FtsQ/DivIB [Bryobacterales bacterium]